MNAGRRWTWLHLALLAGAARTAAALGLAVIPRDGIVYAETARAVAAGDPGAAFTGAQHPLFALLAGALGGTEISCILLAVLAGAAGAPAVLRLGTLLHSRTVGLLAALGYAAAPALVRYGSVPLAEALYVPLVLWAAERALAGRGSPRAAAAAGLLAGLAYLSRPEGLLLPLVLVPGLLLLRRPRSAALLLAGFLLLGGPYAGWLTHGAGELTVSRKKPVLRFVHAEEGFDAHIAEKSKRSGLDRPGIGAAAAETARAWGEATSWAFLALLPVGLLLLFRGGERAPLLLLLALLAADLLLHFRLCHLHGYVGRRHLLAASAWTVLLASGGVLLLAGRRALLAGTVLAAVLVGIAVRPRGLEKLPLKEAGRHILETSGPGSRIASWRTPRVAYYARGTDVPLHRLEGDRLEAAVRSANWLAIVPERLPESERRALRRLGAGPPRTVGEGGWRVEIRASAAPPAPR